MQNILALVYVFVVYAIGDYISIKTKSIVSMLFTCSVIFLAGFWLGVPTSLFEDSQLFSIGALIIPFLLAHMGTMLNLQQLKEQWKTVLIALAAIVGIAGLLMTIGVPIIGHEAAVVAAPPIAGGVIAGIQMSAAADAINRSDLAIMATLIVVVQGFFGYPVASFCLKKEARRVLAKINNNTYDAEFVQEENAEVKKKRLIPAIPAKYVTGNLLLAKTGLVALLAVAVSMGAQKLAGFNILDKNILALLFGVLFAELGFLDKEILGKANSFGLAMAALMVVIFSSLAKATPETILNILPPMLGGLVIGLIGIVLFSWIAGKILKVSPYMAIGIGVSALFGFPGTFIISNEVSSSVSDDAVVQQKVLNAILPKMLVAGFITVSIASVVLAGIMSNFIN